MKLIVTQESWPLAAPFRISGFTFETTETITATIECKGQVGRGEASGVYYRSDTIEHMRDQIESVRANVEKGVTRSELQHLLPAAGARNALDCALWDLEAKLSGRSAWQIAGLEKPHPLLTTFTCGAEDPQVMAQAALRYGQARAIKLKLTGDELDADRVRAVRAVCPRVWLGIDANQGFTRSFLQRIMPVLVENRVELIEQPFPIGQEAQLDGLQSPIPIAADESLQGIGDLPSLAGRVSVVNIKLDKSGGLTEGLAIARKARKLGLKVMVGNMMGTSLAMAPSFIVGQLCDVVDLDGPALLKLDRESPVTYSDGHISCTEALWGGCASP